MNEEESKQESLIQFDVVESNQSEDKPKEENLIDFTPEPAKDGDQIQEDAEVLQTIGN